MSNLNQSQNQSQNQNDEKVISRFVSKQPSISQLEPIDSRPIKTPSLLPTIGGVDLS